MWMILGLTLDFCDCISVDGSRVGSTSAVFRGGGAVTSTLLDVVGLRDTHIRRYHHTAGGWLLKQNILSDLTQSCG